MSTHKHRTFVAETAIWYTVCWIVLIARITSRRMHLGAWKALQIDDYLIVLAMMTITVLTVVMHIVIKTSSNLIAPGEGFFDFAPSEIKTRAFGSKLVLVVEQMQILTVWLVKICLLIIYYRATMLLRQRKLVHAVAGYVGVGFIIMEVLYFAVWCRPFSQYWAVPPNSTQCSAATNHLITNAVLNISSDLLILGIAIPLLRKIMIPLRKKIILGILFMIGSFTIISAALNKFYSFKYPFGAEWTIWYLRESYTAFICANLSLTYPLIQRIWKLKAFSDEYLRGSSPYPPHKVSDRRKERMCINRTVEFAVDRQPREGRDDLVFCGDDEASGTVETTVKSPPQENRRSFVFSGREATLAVPRRNDSPASAIDLGYIPGGGGCEVQKSPYSMS